MNRPENDDERLAALLEGRLDGRSREELLAHLSASEEDRRVFADTAAILRELEEAEAAASAEAETDAADVEVGGVEAEAERVADVIPLRPRSRVWRSPALWGALAAVLAGLLLVPLLTGRGGDAAADPVSLAGRLEAGGGIPAGWELPWDGTRGPEPAEGTARAVQAGAMLVDLALAVEARDSVKTERLAEQVRGRYDPNSGAAGALGQLAELAGAPADSLRPLVERATERLGELWGREHLRLGAWAEASRLAAARRDEAFFRADVFREMLPRADRETASNQTAQAALARIRAAVPAQGPPDWVSLETSFREFLGELAR